MNRNWIRARLVLALIVLVLNSFAPARGFCVDRTRDERSVRAAYVFNLIKYVEWPPNSGEVVIGFIGSPATGEVMQSMLNGKTNQSRTVKVLLSPSNEELQRCNIVYIEDSQTGEIRSALKRLKGRDILTIGDSESFAPSGGMVGLVKVGDQIQLRVNLDATQRSGIKISSRVLNLAVIVRAEQNANN